MFLVPDPATWYVLASSPTNFDWFCLSASVLWAFLFSQVALVSLLLVAPMVHECLFLQAYESMLWLSGLFLGWLLEHLVNVVPMLYILLLLVCVHLLPCWAWFQGPVNPVDPVEFIPMSCHQHCAIASSYWHATQPPCCFWHICHWPQSLKQQMSSWDYQYLMLKVNMILGYVHHLSPGNPITQCLCCTPTSALVHLAHHSEHH